MLTPAQLRVLDTLAYLNDGYGDGVSLKELAGSCGYTHPSSWLDESLRKLKRLGLVARQQGYGTTHVTPEGDDFLYNHHANHGKEKQESKTAS